MAVQTVTARRGRKRSSVLFEESPALLASISDNTKSDGKLKFDLILGTLLNGVMSNLTVCACKAIILVLSAETKTLSYNNKTIDMLILVISFSRNGKSEEWRAQKRTYISCCWGTN